MCVLGGKTLERARVHVSRQRYMYASRGSTRSSAVASRVLLGEYRL